MDEILFTGHKFLHSHLISIYVSLIYNGNKLICLQLFIELIYILLYIHLKEAMQRQMLNYPLKI